MNITQTASERFDFLLKATLYTPAAIIFLLIVTMMNTLFLLLLPVISKYLGHTESVIHLTLKNGTTIANKFMFNPNIRDGIIISDSKQTFSKKTFIHNENILKIDFSTIHYILGGENLSRRNELVRSLNDLNEKERIIVDDILQSTVK